MVYPLRRERTIVRIFRGRGSQFGPWGRLLRRSGSHIRGFGLGAPWWRRQVDKAELAFLSPWPSRGS